MKHLISKKKIIYKVSAGLKKYLQQYGREQHIPIHYSDLLRYDNALTLYDRKGKDTLWETVFYPPSMIEEVYEGLKKVYAILKAGGDYQVMEHLYIDRVDICMYGNTLPFRIRVVNKLNDNFDYFYIKKADSSRIYGLELEHILSPNRINYYVYKETLIEEHIAGIPADQFLKNNITDRHFDETRLAKEFVKFNERCFVRLLGDMHSSNFVIDITPDFEETHYRMRSIDFDQQSYEKRKNVYLPQFFKQNNAFVELVAKDLTPESVTQYQREERALIANRMKSSQIQVDDLLNKMIHDELSPPENVVHLREELAKHYNQPDFQHCHTMGELIKLSLNMLIKK